MMLGLFANEMATAIHLAAREAEHGQIARFRSAPGENDFVRLGLDQRRDFVASIINRSACVPSGAMNTRGIPKMFAEVRLHRSARGMAHRRGGVVIEINHLPLNCSSALAGCLARFGTTATSFSS